MRRLLNILIRSSELIITVSMALLFFTVFLGLLNKLFPSGSGFNELLHSGGFFRSIPTDLTEEGHLLFLDASNLRVTDDVAAVIIKMHNAVKSKRADDIAWSSANEGMRIYSRDSIQTLKGSYAQIRFDGKSYLELEEKSLIVIRLLEKDLFLDHNRSSLVILKGELKGKIGGGQKSLNAEIITPSAIIHVPAKQE